jgi:hypothetical protein
VNKPRVLAISVILAVLVTASFLVVTISPLFIAAWIFAMVGIALFTYGNLTLLQNAKSYAWFAAFPITAWRYMLTDITVSAIFVLAENLLDRSFHIGLFIVIQIVIFAFFAVMLVLLKSGKEMIEARDAEINEKTSLLRFLQADIESLINQYPQYKKPLQELHDAIRYSDPMSHSSLAVYEEQIQRGVMEIRDLNPQDATKIPELCAVLLRQIADRNSRVKIMK